MPEDRNRTGDLRVHCTARYQLRHLRQFISVETIGIGPIVLPILLDVFPCLTL